MSTGKEFHTVGASTGKEQAPYACVWWIGTTNDRPVMQLMQNRAEAGVMNLQ